MKEQCTFAGNVTLPSGAVSKLVRCPTCGAYRELIQRQFKGNNYTFPPHTKKTAKHTDLPSWRYVSSQWQWHTVSYTVNLVYGGIDG